MIILGFIAATVSCGGESYTLTIASTEGGEVMAPGEGTFAYDAETVVNLNAIPDSGYQFVNWTGDVGTIGDVNAPETIITVNGEYSITANFATTSIPTAAAGDYHTVGLRSDGTVLAVGLDEWGQCNVGNWANIIQVAASTGHTVGLKSDGTVVSVGLNGSGQCDVGNWTNIVQVAGGGYSHTVGKVGAHNLEWIADTGEEFTEHSIIYGGYLYVPACDYTNKNGGVQKFSLSGVYQASYGQSTYTQCCPIIAQSGGTDYMFTYDILHQRINRINLSTNMIIQFVSTGDASHWYDLESMGWDTVNNRVIAIVYDTGTAKWYVRSYNMADLSTAWSYEVIVSGSKASIGSPLVYDQYVFWRNHSDGILMQLDLTDGSLVDYLTLGAPLTTGAYSSPIFDPVWGYIYSTSARSDLHGVTFLGLNEVWKHTFDAGIGSDTDHVTHTGMAQPSIWTAMGCHNDMVFVSVREEAATANQYHTKIYAIYAANGHKAWSYTRLWHDGQTSAGILLTDDHIVLGATDLDYLSTNYHIGSFYVLNQGNGTLVHKGALPWSVSCGGPTQAYDGRVIFCGGGAVGATIPSGLVSVVKLGWGTTDDSPHWMKNSYHNGYCGSRLTIDTDLICSTNSSACGGTVVAVGDNYWQQCDVGDWTGIVQVAAGDWHTVGLKTDGTVVAVGDNSSGQCNVGGWTDIIQVAAGNSYTIGLKTDGTVVTVGDNSSGQCNVGGWTDIIQVAAGNSYAIGLKTDGTVVAVGDNSSGQCNVGDWTDILGVSAGSNHTVGVKSDGTVVAIGLNDLGQCNVGGWNLN